MTMQERFRQFPFGVAAIFSDCLLYVCESFITGLAYTCRTGSPFARASNLSSRLFRPSRLRH
jgi:hypothetical protein